MEKEISRDFSKFAPGMKRLMDMLFWVDIVFFAAALIGAVTVFALPEKYFHISAANLEKMKMSLSMGNSLYYKVRASGFEIINIKSIIEMFLIMGASSAIILALVFKQLSEILKRTIKSSPFDYSNSKRIALIGKIIIGGAFLIEAAKAGLAYVIIITFKLNDFNVNYSIVNFGMLLFGILILILAQVFKYGSYLQQEYDSTV